MKSIVFDIIKIKVAYEKKHDKFYNKKEVKAEALALSEWYKSRGERWRVYFIS